MKKLALSILTGSILAATSFAGTEVRHYSKDKQPVETLCFADQEFQLDIFGAYHATEGGGYSDGWGGGIALNYYFTRNIGFGVDSTARDGGDELVFDHTARILVRFPIDDACIAPYIFGGGGYEHNGAGNLTAHAGAGIEFRVKPEEIGLFAEGRYTWVEEDGDNFTQIRAGVRFVF